MATTPKKKRASGGWNHDNANWKDKECVVCATSFTPRSGVHKFCSPVCKGKWKYMTGSCSTESQYKEISGNWGRYLSRLLYVGGRKRKHLTREVLLLKLEEQGYKCALSGVSLTCELEVGVQHPTNVSIDRIQAGGEYTVDNIQLVCAVLNSWRSDTDRDVFVDWCGKVADYNR